MDILEEIRAGNKDVIKGVYKENVKDVYNFAKSITGNHDTALDATKKTFVILFNRIQKGEDPTNIRLAALKIAYDEACAIAMPSTEVIDSPYDKGEKDDEMSFRVSEEKPEPEQETPQPEAEAAKPQPQPEAEAKPAPQPEAGDIAEAEAEPALMPDSEGGKSAAENAQAPEDGSGAAQEEEKVSKKEKKKKKKENKKKRKSEEEKEKEGGEDYKEEQPLLYEIDNENEEEQEAEDEYEEPSENGHPVLSAILLIINIILVLILIWFILGLLQNLGAIPENLNMGHQWFNDNIYELF